MKDKKLKPKDKGFQFEPKQKEFIELIHKYRNTYLIGAQRSGKTTAAIYYCFLKAYFLAPGENGIIGAGSSQLQTNNVLINAWRDTVPKGFKYKVYGKGERIDISQVINGEIVKSHIYLATGAKPERLDGLTCNWAYIDEVQACEDLVSIAKTRLSSGPDPKLICTGIPENGWLSDLYDNHFPNGRDNKQSNSCWLSIKTSDNSHIDDHFQNDQKTLSPQEYAVKALGQFSANPDQVYPDFDKRIHIKELTINPNAITYVGIDFNNKPFASTLFQLINNKIYQFAEIHDSIGGSTFDHAKQIKDKLNDFHITDLNRVILFPDSSGNNQNHAGTSDFIMLQQSGFNKIDSLSHNPLIKDRDNIVRAALKNAKGESSLIISPECKWTILSFQKLLTKGRERSIHNHILDALGYAVFKLKPLQEKTNKPTEQISSPRPLIPAANRFNRPVRLR